MAVEVQIGGDIYSNQLHMVASWDSIGVQLYRWTMTMELRYAVYNYITMKWFIITDQKEIVLIWLTNLWVQFESWIRLQHNIHGSWLDQLSAMSQGATHPLVNDGLIWSGLGQLTLQHRDVLLHRRVIFALTDIRYLKPDRDNRHAFQWCVN